MLLSEGFWLETLWSPSPSPPCPQISPRECWLRQNLTIQPAPLTNPLPGGNFQPGLAPVGFQNERCFLPSTTFRERGNKAFLRERGQGYSKRVRRHPGPPAAALKLMLLTLAGRGCVV